MLQIAWDFCPLTALTYQMFLLQQQMLDDALLQATSLQVTLVAMETCELKLKFNSSAKLEEGNRVQLWSPYSNNFTKWKEFWEPEWTWLIV